MKRSVIYFFFLVLIHSMTSGQTQHYSINRTGFSSDKYAEFSPVYYKDGIVFCSDRSTGLINFSATGDHGLISMFYVDTIEKSGKVKLFSKELNTFLNDGPAVFNNSEDNIYYSRNIKIEGSSAEISSPRNKLGLFSADRDDEEWTRIRPLRFNSEWYNITTPCLSPDGSKLYFASDMEEGYGGMDLYYCEWREGYWDDPVNLGPVINSDGNDSYPFLLSEDVIIFSSDGHPGMGKKDIFLSKQVDDSWMKPMAFLPPVNSEHDDFSLISGPIMNSGYFSSDRHGSIDIFEFKTNYPQVFYQNYQKENNYCFEFEDSGSIQVDTTRLEYVWYFGEGEKKSGKNINYCYPGPGQYDIFLNIVDRTTGELFFQKRESSVIIKDIEQAYIQSSSVVIKNEEITFDGSKSHLPGYTVESYLWNFSNTNFAEGEKVSYSFENKGEYDVTLFLNLTRKSDGEKERKYVSRKIIVVENQLEKEYYLTREENIKPEYQNIESSENAEIITRYSSEQKYLKDAIFCVELLSSKEDIGPGSESFQNVPDKYRIIERYDEEEKTYSYTIEHQLELMKLLPAFREVKALGFNNAEVKLFLLTDPAEIDFFYLLNNFNTSADLYFDRTDQLTSRANIMLDQLIRYMNNYPDVKIEVSVHTDNLGNSSSNFALSERRAENIKEYLLSRNIAEERIVAKGYGEIKPVAPNTYEINRMKNRRVEFRIMN